MLDEHTVIQVFSLVFGAFVVAIVSAVFKVMFGISNSIKSLTEKTIQVLTRMDHFDEEISDIKIRLRGVEKSGCDLAKHGQCVISS